jgi:DNA (cytosine-5)-methyltransferase 1
MKEGRLNGLDLFSGIGGNTIALRKYVKTIAYCERDTHAQSVLLSRMLDGSIERAPIWDDITTLRGGQFDVPIDIIVGGFPCQDISCAGRGAGIKDGARSGLFFEVVRLITELKPTFVFLENVAAIRTRGLDIVLNELTQAGYDCRYTMLCAASVGALHKRERFFLLATNSERLKLWEQSRWSGRKTGKSTAIIEHNGSQKFMADTMCERLPGRDDRASFEEKNGTLARCEFSRADAENRGSWAVEPNVGRVANGVSLRVDRIKRLGNGVVPDQAEVAFEILVGLL